MSTLTSRLERSRRERSTLPSRWKPGSTTKISENVSGRSGGIAGEVDDLLDRPERRHGDEVRLHEAAGGFFRVEQVALQGGALALRHLIENFLLVVRLEAFEQVGGVVAVEIADAARQDVVRQRLRQLVADLLVDLGQHLEVEVGAQRLDEPDALLGIEQLDEVGKVGVLDVRYQRTYQRGIVRLERLGDRAHEFGRRRRRLALGPSGAARSRSYFGGLRGRRQR